MNILEIKDKIDIENKEEQYIGPSVNDFLLFCDTEIELQKTFVFDFILTSSSIHHTKTECYIKLKKILLEELNEIISFIGKKIHKIHHHHKNHHNHKNYWYLQPYQSHSIYNEIIYYSIHLFILLFIKKHKKYNPQRYPTKTIYNNINHKKHIYKKYPINPQNFID